MRRKLEKASREGLYPDLGSGAAGEDGQPWECCGWGGRRKVILVSKDDITVEKAIASHKCFGYYCKEGKSQPGDVPTLGG